MLMLAAFIAGAILLGSACRWLTGRGSVQRVLMVGGGPLAREVIAALEARPRLRQRVVGLVDDGPGPGPASCPCLGTIRELDRVLAEVRPHRVIVALASRRGCLPFKSLLALRLRGVIVQDGVDAYERLTGKVPIEALTPTSVLFGTEFRGFQLDLCLAHALSVPVAAVALLLLVPVFVLIAVAIKLDSRGPLFFVQERVGRQGKRFRLVKFRTMLPSDTHVSEWERDNHKRLTRVGRHLRRCRLDELPQLYNILRGDMCLVGPRPHPVSNVLLFAMVTRNVPECGEQIPYYALRSLVRPGLTGWAQVRYHYANDLEEEIEKMKYDLYYIKHRSAWLDARILLETLGVVVRGPQATTKPAMANPPVEMAPRVPAPILHLAEESRAAAIAAVPPVAASTVTFETALDFDPPAVRARRPEPSGRAKGRPAPMHGDKI